MSSALAGCSGKIYAALFDDNLSTLFPILASSLRIESISITPDNPSVPSGVPQDYTLTATLANGNVRPLTAKELGQVEWTWDASGTSTLFDIADVDIQNIGINSLPRVTAIKTDYMGGNEEITLTAVLRDIIATEVMTINNADLVSINITPETASITRLATHQYTANGTYTDGSIHDISDIVDWDSDDDLIATVDSTGKVTGQYNGAGTETATITADDGGSISDTATIDVTAPTLSNVSVSPISTSIAEGTYVQFRATAIYSNNTTQDVTDAANWSCLTGGVATIDNVTNKGLTQGDNAGTTTVRATFDGVNGDATLDVSSATLQYLVISAAGNKTSIADGTKLQFTVSGVFSDNSTQNLTDDPFVAWGSTNTGIAAFSPGDPAGLITGLDPGATVVSATYDNGVDTPVDSQEYDLDVTNAILLYITISPQDPVAYVIAYGTTQQFTVTGTYNDTTTQDLTTQVDWLSSVGTIASIDESGLASTTTSVGVTEITANYPKGATMTHADNTNLQVISMPLTSITITPSGKSIYVGGTFPYMAMGSFTDGLEVYNLDITSLVLWSSNDTNLNVSNSSGSQGLATALSVGDGEAKVTASRGAVTSNESTVAISLSDTTAPTMVSAQLLFGDRLKVTFSEPMDYTTATLAENYKVLTSATVTGACSTSDNLFFTNNAETLTVTSVEFFTQSTYILQLGSGTSNTQYTVIGDRNDLTDIAATPNTLGCPSKTTFTGVDTVDPYLVSVVNSEPTKIIVKYSEPMMTGGGTAAADNKSNYTLAEDPIYGLPGDDLTITTITMIDESTFILNLDKSAQSTQYKLTIATGVTDLAPTPYTNSMGTPRILTFQGNEQLKIVSAIATDLNHIKVAFSKPVLSGNDIANSAECDDATECHGKYKLFPRTGSGTDALLGNITSAVRGTGNETNTVTLTHVTQQEGISYTVVAANDTNLDGFDDEPVAIKAEAGTTDYMQASPKDRSTFIGLGDVIDSIDDGEYFTDPFADGSIFTWSFVYGGKVYLGTNDSNNAAFRFDPDGYNSVLISFDIELGYTQACSSATGFGYTFASETCAATEGFNNEYGVVGFNAGTITIGTTDYEILMLGPLKDGVTDGYYTQDLDTELDWIPFNFAGTGGGNTDSIQTTYAYGANMYYAASSNQGTQAPVVCRTPFTDPEIDGLLNVGTPVDMALRSIDYIGKNAGSFDNYKGTAEVIGIDAMISFNNRLYAANNGGLVYSADYTDMSPETRSHPNAFRPDDGDVSEPTASEETLVLPLAPAGLGKISPGERGVPVLLVYNGNLYMARNVASTSARHTSIRGELWKCTPGTSGGATTCEPADWTRIISGSESDLPTGSYAISLLQNNGTGKLYVGFDNVTVGQGASVWRIASTNPPANAGTMASGGWTRQGLPGLNNSHIKFYSSATINDGTYDYVYLTAGDDTNAIRIYRQRE